MTEMKDSMRTMARPYAILFAIALVVALLARIGLAVMDAAGWLAYDYISASGVPMLDVICSILTGSAFVAFLFAAALTLMVSAAGAVLQAALFAKGVKGAGKPAAAFLWGWAAAAMSLVCLLVVASGILSGVQVGSMSSKLPGAGRSCWRRCASRRFWARFWVRRRRSCARASRVPAGV